MKLESPLRNARRLAAALLLAIAGVLASGAAPETRAADLEPGLQAALARGAPVRIIALLPEGADARRVEALIDAMAGPGFEPGHRFGRSPGFAARVTPQALDALVRAEPELRVGLDPPLELLLDESRPLTAIDTLHGAGIRGGGVDVAVLDTGVDTDHPDLIGTIAAQQCFCTIPSSSAGCCPNGLTTQTGAGAAEDWHGHGTQTGGVVVSQDQAAPLGAAPDADLIAIRVTGPSGGLSSDLILGLEWIETQQPQTGAVSISLAFGSAETGDCDNASAAHAAIATATDSLHDAGILVVAASGNTGVSGTGMHAPACIEQVASVASVWDADSGLITGSGVYGCPSEFPVEDGVPCYTNRSATTDVFAPGGRMKMPALGGGQGVTYGTSYAAPMVAGCAADLLSAVPSATPDDLIAAITSSPVLVDPGGGLGLFPRLHCTNALHYLVPHALPALPGGAPMLALLAALLGAVGLGARRFTR